MRMRLTRSSSSSSRPGFLRFRTKIPWNSLHFWTRRRGVRRPAARRCAYDSCEAAFLNILTLTSARLDQTQRFLTHKNPGVVLIAPAEWRDVPILAQRSAAVPFLEPRAQRGANV